MPLLARFTFYHNQKICSCCGMYEELRSSNARSLFRCVFEQFLNSHSIALLLFNGYSATGKIITVLT